MTRRIFGLETEYGITYAHPTDDVTLSADEVARQLFKKVVAWGRSSNVFFVMVLDFTWMLVHIPSTQLLNVTQLSN